MRRVLQQLAILLASCSIKKVRSPVSKRPAGKTGGVFFLWLRLRKDLVSRSVATPGLLSLAQAACAQGVQLADLQLLAPNISLRRRSSGRLFRGRIGNRLNQPRPAEVTISVEGPSAAPASPNFHSPVIAVAGNCEPKRDCSCDGHSAQYPNQECAYRFISSRHSFYTTSNLACVPTLNSALRVRPNFGLSKFG